MKQVFIHEIAVDVENATRVLDPFDFGLDPGIGTTLLFAHQGTPTGERKEARLPVVVSFYGQTDPMRLPHLVRLFEEVRQ